MIALEAEMTADSPSDAHKTATVDMRMGLGEVVNVRLQVTPSSASDDLTGAVFSVDMSCFSEDDIDADTWVRDVATVAGAGVSALVDTRGYQRARVRLATAATGPGVNTAYLALVASTAI